MTSIKLAKIISNKGYCSRRDAEKLIVSGAVKVNGIEQKDVATRASSCDIISINGVDLITASPSTRVWLYNKPQGYITSHCDPFNRPTIFDALKLKTNLQHIISAGRLDINTCGLMIITNKAAIARFFELPKNKIRRVYSVKIYGQGNLSGLIGLTNKKITIHGCEYFIDQIELCGSLGKQHKINITLCEGKNREIRNLVEYFGFIVSKLTRIEYGPFQLDNLRPNELVEITNHPYIASFI